MQVNNSFLNALPLNAPPLLEPLLDFPRPPAQSFLRAEESARFEAAALTDFCRRENLTPLAALLAALDALLLRHTGQPQRVIGALSPDSRRDNGETFVNPVPLLLNTAGETTVRQQLAAAQQAIESAAARRHLPFDDLAAQLGATDIDRAPLFQVMLLTPGRPTLTAEPLTPQHIAAAARYTAPCDLVLLADLAGGNLHLTVQYDAMLFEPDTIRALLARWEVLLGGLLTQPDTPLAALPLLTPAERRRVLLDWNDTRVQYPRDAAISQLFEAQAAATPQAVAVEFMGQTLTYDVLNRRANQLAHHLRAQGLAPETPVTLFAERSLEMVIALLGILKAGGAYVPLDTAYPAARLRLMLEDTRSPFILTQQHLAARLPDNAARHIRLDADWPAIAAQPETNPPAAAAGDSLAYIMYTSGSTGRPKGIEIPQRGVVRLVKGANFASLSAAEIFLQLAPVSFDAATLEIWGALLNGAKLVLMPPQPPSLAELARAIERHGVTILWLTAGLFHQMAEAHPDTLAGVRQLLAGGDVLRPEPVRQILRRMQPLGHRLINGYGPTENTTFTCCHPMTDPAQVGATVPIGRPISNTQVYILNEALQPQPPGIPGELYIAGDGLARGYLNQPELTATSIYDLRFTIYEFGAEAETAVSNSQFAIHNSQCYRSGDMARWLPDGTIEFLGRRDQQVKIRGFRIEPGEIEAALTRHPAVAQAVVQPHQPGDGPKILVAFVRLADGGDGWLSLSRSQADMQRALRHHLQAALPDYMAPSAFVFVDAFPLNPNGKIDRAALPAPSLERPALAAEFEPPAGDIEQTLAGLWRELLGFEQIGRHDDFFALGGHSLLATQLVSRIHKTFKVELPLPALFELPTLAGLAEAITRHEVRAGQTIPHRPEDGPARLSYAQQRYWFLDQLEPNNAAYNMPTLALTLRGALDAEALERSLLEIIRRHESLRTTFPLVDGEPRQHLNPPALTLQRFDLRPLPDTERPAEAERLAAVQARHTFNLAEGPLLRTSLLHLADDEHRLLVTMHHIIADGWSIGLFYRELAAIYPAFAAGQPSPLDELPLQYADFAAWQQQQLQTGALRAQLEYWRAQLADPPPSLLLPTDHPRPAQMAYHPARLHLFKLPPGLSQRVQAASRAQGVTPFMLLLAAFKVLLYRYSRQTDLCVGSLIANRNLAELEPLIGYFVNVQVMRANLAGNPTFAALLRQVKQTTLAAYQNQDIPFEKLLEALQPERDLSLTPFFQTLFVLQNAPLPPLELPGLSMQLAEVESGLAMFDLVVELAETPAGLSGLMRYDARLFEAATIERMAGHFQTLLAAIVDAPDRAIDDLPLLTEAEQRQLLVTWNQTARDWPLADCYPQVFEAQAERTPDAIAVTCGEKRLTYRQLNERANSLAWRLVELGVGPEVLAALLAERSIDFLLTILAIFKAGGAYLPLDPLHPAERTRQILRQSRAPLVLATAEFGPLLAEALAGIPPAEQPQVLSLEKLLRDERPTANLSPRANPDNLAYVLFTSGSTGLPKGAMVEQVGMLNHIWSKISDLGMTETDILAHNSPQSFDISVWQFLAPLLLGGQVHIFPNEIAFNPARLLHEVARQRITVLQMVPSMMQALIQAAEAGDGPPPDLSALRWAVPTGEAFTTELCRRWFATYPNIPVLNTYGSTECSDDQCHHPVTQMPPPEFDLPIIPLGRPIPNMQAYVLDSQLKPVPIGVPGEIYIGGIGVGRGYLHDAERTAQAFIPNPFTDLRFTIDDFGLEPESSVHHSQLYKTGDLGRFLPDGALDFLGRVDFMVKIRGFRIELGEIEAALLRHPAVREAVVVVHSPAQSPAEKYLAAYVVAQAGQLPDVADLRHYLKEKLPDYMAPASLMLLPEMPLNNNGKIDRRALPQPDFAPGAAADPPRTATEAALADIWAEVLELSRVGIHDDLFELGGHSLLVMQLLFKVKEKFGVTIPMRQLFRSPTVAGLAVVIDEMLKEGHRPE